MLNLPIFYHATTKKAITVFGSIFNNISIERRDADGKVAQTIKVPLTYAPKQKYIARVQQEPDIDGKNVGVTLPRMAFEIRGLQYNRARKLNSNIKNINISEGKYLSQYNPVPYDMEVDLFIMVKNQEDGLQIVEQILPIFTPQYTVTINSISEMQIKEDLPIILNAVNFEDNYEGDFHENRIIVWTLSFTLQLNYFGPIDGTESGIIKRTEVTFYNDALYQDKRAEVDSEVSPFDASETDNYTIIDTIEGW